MNICVKCGAMAIGNNLCRKHFRHQQQMINFKAIEINRCRSCGGVYSKGRKFDDIGKALERFIVAKNARFSSKIHLSGNRATALIEAEGFEHGIPVRERHEKEFVLKKMMCLDCSKLSGG
ncbi:MAG: hypothetical protein HYW25_05350, partial [Candidatus Aenigmarchaeota archaeon]|nr:hypothetical protein [Candidatus Aenigmarchaeota archaeon]